MHLASCIKGDEKKLKKKLERKLRLKEFRIDHEQRYLIKRSELDEVLEEVFDRLTLMTLYDLLNSKQIKELHGVISAGKESRVYHALGKDGQEMAVKIYLITSAEFRRNRLGFVANDPRFKRVPKDFRKFVYLWAKREFKNLEVAYEANVPVPKPEFVKDNILGMGFLGMDGVPYPLLSDVDIEYYDGYSIYRSVLKAIEDLYKKAKLVHGDLSQYNILVGENSAIYVIDLAQAVHVDHPLSIELLRKSIRTLNGFFLKKGIDIKEEEDVIKGIVGKFNDQFISYEETS